MRKTLKLTMSVAALALTASLVAPAGAQEEATGVDSLETSRSGNFLFVTGTATFVDETKLVGEDVTGDATIPGIGADIGNITISRPSPTGPIHFTLHIADQPPTLNGLPEAAAYFWDINVETGGSSSGFELWAARSAQWAQPGGVSPVFRRYVCNPNPNPPPDVTCGSDVAVAGRMEDGVVEWQVPASQVSAQPGSVITGTAIEVVTSASGALWGGLRLDQSGAIQDHGYTVPGPTVEFGIAEAGTPEGAVPLTETAGVNGSEFTGAVDVSGLAPGDYVVVAKACYGAGNCGLSSTTVTI